MVFSPPLDFGLRIFDFGFFYSAITNPHSAILHPQSAISDPQFAILHPHSAITNPHSAILMISDCFVWLFYLMQ
jgi:hypothetical protein